jgi:hypothetical protein
LSIAAKSPNRISYPEQAAEKSGTCFDKLSMNGFFSMSSISDPFVLSTWKDSEAVFSGQLVFDFISSTIACLAIV